jgi:hypothetical protein
MIRKIYERPHSIKIIYYVREGSPCKILQLMTCSLFQIRVRTWIVPSRKCASWTSRGTQCAGVVTLVPWNSHLCAGLTARPTRMNAVWDRRPAGPGRISGSSTEENVAQVSPVRRYSSVGLLWTRYWTFGFHKMLGSSWGAAQASK